MKAIRPYRIQINSPVQIATDVTSGMSVNSIFSGASLLPSKISAWYLMIAKMAIGIVIIRSLLMVVVFENSARNSQRFIGTSCGSKKVKSAQLIQDAFANMVTYELSSSFE